jgi:hypothetical protein
MNLHAALLGRATSGRENEEATVEELKAKELASGSL